MPKPAFVTENKPTRTDATIRAYLKGGSLLLARAREKMVGTGDVIDAFRALFEDPNLALRPATTRLYRQQVRAVIGQNLHEGELTRGRALEGFAEITRLLEARRGRPPKRTSAKKLKAAQYRDYLLLLEDFHRRSLPPGGLELPDRILALLLGVGPHLGLRPAEWLNATLTPTHLVVANAKFGNGRAPGPVRSIELSEIPKIAGVLRRLIEDIKELAANKSSWRKVLGVLGERLARVCRRLGLRRWSLYTLRHIAQASWKRAGLSAAMIAALAGHISTKTARNHYAGARHGWDASFACARPAPSLVAMIEAHNCPLIGLAELSEEGPTPPEEDVVETNEGPSFTMR
jgi:integrase